MMFIYDRKLILIILLAIMTAIALIPASVYATGEKTTFQQEYTYKEGEIPNIHEEISQFGQVFKLVSVTEPVATGSLPRERTYTYKVSTNYTPDQLSQVPENVKLTPIYGSGKRQVDRAGTIENLPDNDVDRLPRFKTYSDTNGHGPGAGVRGQLVLAEVRYEPKGWDEDGIPNNYTAYVFYRGEETYLALTHYEAVSTYTDTITEDGEVTYTVIATYEAEAPSGDPDEDLPPAVIEEGGTDTDNSGGEATASNTTSFRLPFTLGSLSPFAAAGTATIAAAVLTFIMLGIFNRRRLRESTSS